MSGHLADLWADLVDQERKIELEKKRLKTMILTCGQDYIRGQKFSLSISTTTQDRFDTTAFQQADPTTALQYRKLVSATRISVSKV